jgi:anti-sigma28 factor (negative regulator of flagellin synthesis)
MDNQLLKKKYYEQRVLLDLLAVAETETEKQIIQGKLDANTQSIEDIKKRIREGNLSEQPKKVKFIDLS